MVTTTKAVGTLNKNVLPKNKKKNQILIMTFSSVFNWKRWKRDITPCRKKKKREKETRQVFESCRIQFMRH